MGLKVVGREAHGAGRRGQGLGVLLMAGIVAGLATSALAQPAHIEKQPVPQPEPAAERPPEPPGAARAPTADDPAMRVPRHRIDRIVIRYMRENPGHPAPEQLLEAAVPVQRTPEGFAAARPDELPDTDLVLADVPYQSSNLYADGVLLQLAPAVVRRMQDLGFIGVYVEPSPDQLRVEDGRIVDVRPEGDTSLVLNVTTGVVTEVRTVGLGDRLPEDQTVNHPLHAKIRERSPVRPYREGQEEPRSDLLRRDLIDDFVFRLNRHPGRRVDVAVAAPGTEPGALSLDYLVTENRPWFIFGQLSNTGTESTSDWRERLGFVHNQLTNSDDTLIIDFLTANFDKVNALTASYERPLLDSERWRWRAYGSWYEYTASELGLPDADFEGDGYNAGAEAIWNFFQRRDLFLDAVAGARFEHISVDNELADIEGDEDFFLPYAGLRLERVRESSRSFVSLMYEWNVADADDDEVERLGRTNADDDWEVLRLDASHSFYLEPLLDRSLGRAESLAHEIALSARGQYGFNNRLIPNAEEAVGGLYTVRGYPEAIVAGDSVIAATAEYRFHLPRALAPDPEPGRLFGQPFRYRPQYRYGPTDWDLIFRGFVDYAWVNVSRPEDFESDQRLLGAGLGVELAVTRRLNVRLDWGWALEDVEDAAGEDEVGAGDSEVYFVLTVIF